VQFPQFCLDHQVSLQDLEQGDFRFSGKRSGFPVCQILEFRKPDLCSPFDFFRPQNNFFACPRRSHGKVQTKPYKVLKEEKVGLRAEKIEGGAKNRLSKLHDLAKKETGSFPGEREIALLQALKADLMIQKEPGELHLTFPAEAGR